LHATSDICKALYRLHPQLRLAWVGRERTYPDELNAGSFGLVQLYHSRDVGTPDDPVTYREFYDVTVRPDAFGGYELGHVDRGPIFSRTGSTRRDWDYLTRTPMLIGVLSDYGVSHYDVFSKRFLTAVQYWLTSPYDRAVQAAKAKGREAKRKVRDMGDQMAADLWKSAQRSDATSTTMSKKHAAQDIGVKQLRQWKERGGKDWENAFMPPKPKGA
jgi:hypothetical protein